MELSRNTIKSLAFQLKNSIKRIGSFFDPAPAKNPAREKFSGGPLSADMPLRASGGGVRQVLPNQFVVSISEKGECDT